MKKGALIKLVQTIIEEEIVRKDEDDFIVPYRAVEIIVDKVIEDVAYNLFIKYDKNISSSSTCDMLELANKYIRQSIKELYGITL
jgi:hypothetical protein